MSSDPAHLPVHGPDDPAARVDRDGDMGGLHGGAAAEGPRPAVGLLPSGRDGGRPGGCGALDCKAPSCRPGGRGWVAKSCAAADIEAFNADIVAYMRLTGETSVGKAAAKVFELAMQGAEQECLFS